MTVKLIETGEKVRVTDCYGARLVEQGKAVLCPAPPAKKKPVKKADDDDGPEGQDP